jgi:hypothetical protein
LCSTFFAYKQQKHLILAFGLYHPATISTIPVKSQKPKAPILVAFVAYNQSPKARNKPNQTALTIMKI